MNINVVPDGKTSWKVLVDGGMNGCHPFSSKEIANHQAVVIRDKHYPHANVNLAV